MTPDQKVELQAAYDALMGLPDEEAIRDGQVTNRYRELWRDYLKAGGSLSMMNEGINSDQWKQTQKLT